MQLKYINSIEKLKGGQIIISNDVFKRVGAYFNHEQLKEEDPHHTSENGPFYKIKSAK